MDTEPKTYKNPAYIDADEETFYVEDDSYDLNAFEVVITVQPRVTFPVGTVWKGAYSGSYVKVAQGRYILVHEPHDAATLVEYDDKHIPGRVVFVPTGE